MKRLKRGWIVKTMLVGSVLMGMALGCARAPLKEPRQALRKMSSGDVPALQDDLPLEPLLDAVAYQVAYLEKQAGNPVFQFGEARFTQAEYLAGLKRFIELGKGTKDRSSFLEQVRREFDFYEVYGREEWGEVFITSYFEPWIEGSTRPSERFSQPLYSTPDDLISVDLTAFNPKFSEERKYRGRVAGGRIVPYFTRAEIDGKGALNGKKLELCWVDPIDAFFLQIQGSGTIHLDNGKSLRLIYAEKNGQAYEAVGKFLLDRIPSERMNLHTIEAYLRSLSRQEAQAYLDRNPSYVFFKASEESAVTFLGVPAVDGRTIATDRKYFPKGALAFLSFGKPVFDNADQALPTRTEPVARFVLDQDIGGAITGGGRVDLFWGRGPEAKRMAGAMKNPGRLYYLAPKTKR